MKMVVEECYLEQKNGLEKDYFNDKQIQLFLQVASVLLGTGV